MTETPISPYEETLGMIYFARMLDKIRKMEAGVLREDFHEHIGKGLDARCAQFLRVTYEDIRTKTLEGSADADVLNWCMAEGRALDDNDILIWNAFLTKLGWQDHVSENLIHRKDQSGLQDRDEIETMLEYMEVDEGRKP